MTIISLYENQDCASRFGILSETTAEVRKLYQNMEFNAFEEIHTRTQLLGEDASSFSSSV